jgi:hypothetical protein
MTHYVFGFLRGISGIIITAMLWLVASVMIAESTIDGSGIYIVTGSLILFLVSVLLHRR